jgi:tRNA(Arg) A34 adenosine deaminase TadA
MNIEFLREAIRLSIEKMEANEGGPFGAVVVRNGEIIGRGWNRVTSTKDPTAHAEVVAIRDACSHLNTFSLAGCEIYRSCEPCPLCLAAIYWSRLDRIYYATLAMTQRQRVLTTGAFTVKQENPPTSVRSR